MVTRFLRNNAVLRFTGAAIGHCPEDARTGRVTGVTEVKEQDMDVPKRDDGR
jgi:hypothetical protein